MRNYVMEVPAVILDTVVCHYTPSEVKRGIKIYDSARGSETISQRQLLLHWT